MPTYSYRLRGSLVRDTIAGVPFLAAVNTNYPTDNYVLNQFVPGRLDRFIDGVLNNTKLLTPSIIAAAKASNRGASSAIEVTVSRTLTSEDVDNILDVTAVSAITVPNDTILDITDPSIRVAVAGYQATAGALSFVAGAGVTFRGTAPTAAQYTTVGLMHVGLNEWAYL